MAKMTMCTQKQVHFTNGTAAHPNTHPLDAHFYVLRIPVPNTKWTFEEIEKAMSYRTVKLITHYWGYESSRGDYTCCLCPTCDYPLEREFADFCCGCGQRLKWGSVKKLKFKENPKFGEYGV